MNVDFNWELRRKFFHCASIVFPITYLFLTKLTMVITMLVITGIILYADISRHHNKKIQDLVDKIFKKLMREREYSGTFKLSGTSYMFLGFFISCILFSKGTAISAMLVLIISDTASAIVGKAVEHAKPGKKTLEGAAAFLLTSFLIGVLSYTFEAYDTGFFSILIAAIVTTYVEFYSDKIGVNDNLTIPISYGITISILDFLF